MASRLPYWTTWDDPTMRINATSGLTRRAGPGRAVYKDGAIACVAAASVS